MAPEDVLAVYKQYGIEMAPAKQPAAESTAAPTGAGQNAATAPAAAEQNLPHKPVADTAVVWKLGADNSLEPVKVSLGITDHAYTQVNAVLSGKLQEGDELVIRSIASKPIVPSGIRR
jgi:hypothetical protein